MKKKKTPRTAELGIAEELRNMKVGDVVQFPIPKYNYNSIRSSPFTTLINETLEGRKWKNRVDYNNGNVVVTRIS